jgi:DNA polymerase III epsilon subunit-like protein
MILVIDIETTGLVHYTQPDLDPRQPHLVEVAASLVDPASNETVAEMSRIVRPDGWTIPAATVAIHGITTQQARGKGRFAGDVLEELLGLARRADLLVAHNVAFDHRVVRIALARFLPDEIPWWNLLPRFCTMDGARKACGKGKLGDAYEALCGMRHETKHQAIGDTDAARAIYFELLRRAQGMGRPA